MTMTTLEVLHAVRDRLKAGAIDALEAQQRAEVTT